MYEMYFLAVVGELVFGGVHKNTTVLNLHSSAPRSVIKTLELRALA